MLVKAFKYPKHILKFAAVGLNPVCCLAEGLQKFNSQLRCSNFFIHQLVGGLDGCRTTTKIMSFASLRTLAMLEEKRLQKAISSTHD